MPPDRTSPALRGCELSHLRLIRVAGEERAQFLQGQITQDLREINPARSALYGWTTAQGRLLAVGQIFDWRGALWLTVPTAMAESIARRLRMFVLRARTTVEVTDTVQLGLWGEAAAGALALAGDALPATPLACVGAADSCAMRVGGDPARVLVATEKSAGATLLSTLGAVAGAESEWHLADIRAGLPSIGPGTDNALLPQMVNLDLIGGIGFAKGCYTGQEIITRIRHIGRIKRRTLRYRCATDHALAPGTPIFATGREAGQVIAAARAAQGQEILAVTLLEALGGPLFADREQQHPLERLALPYRIPEIDARSAD